MHDWSMQYVTDKLEKIAAAGNEDLPPTVVDSLKAVTLRQQPISPCFIVP